MFPFAPENLIGVDIGSSAIKVVKLRGGRGSYRLEAAACTKIPEGGPAEQTTGVSQTLREILSVQKIRARRVAWAIGSPSLNIVPLLLPNMPEKDMKEAVKWEVRKEAKVPAEELITDYVTREGRAGAGGKISLIAFGARRKQIEHMMEIFTDASLEVRLIDTLPTALLSAFDLNNVWEKGVNYAMLDIGYSQSTLTVLKEQRLRFIRVVPFGGHDLTLALARALGKSDDEAEAEKIAFGLSRPPLPFGQGYESGDTEEAERVRAVLKETLEGLITEIVRSFDYYHAKFREAAISKVFLCGGTAALKGIDEYLTEQTGFPCFVDDPLRGVRIPRGFDREGLKATAPFLTAATGLATRRDPL